MISKYDRLDGKWNWPIWFHQGPIKKLKNYPRLKLVQLSNLVFIFRGWILERIKKEDSSRMFLIKFWKNLHQFLKEYLKKSFEKSQEVCLELWFWPLISLFVRIKFLKFLKHSVATSPVCSPRLQIMCASQMRFLFAKCSSEFVQTNRCNPFCKLHPSRTNRFKKVVKLHFYRHIQLSAV